MARSRSVAKERKKKLCFVDVFAGCGGLSLGLLNAGWMGRFAVEKNRDAFNTLAENLIRNKQPSFVWPKWLPQKACTTANLLSKYWKQLAKLKGKVDLLAGAPPCQGFSLAGRRIYSDPRNSLFKQYLDIVARVEPRFLLVENVQGFSLPFKKNSTRANHNKTYAEILCDRLQSIGYTVFSELVNFSEYGVPQNRNRFILIAIRNGDPALDKLRDKSPFDRLRGRRKAFLKSKNLPTGGPVSARQAIADLEVEGKSLIKAQDQRIGGFQQIEYAQARTRSRFVALMRQGAEGSPDSIRLPRHRPTTVRQFAKIMATCTRGQSLNNSDRLRLGIKKQALTPLHAQRPASTVTTLPDDIVHYSEPRILTVRENARLQTFPDWFRFTGDYTTGGKKRRRDCPRYTQVGNAVPPLFSEAIGLVLRNLGSN
jgi:DNA (cytosine-5)-methyltransferase 1